ncbi:MAG: PD40 domain-containing protein, partial [Gemmatimonadetes bacterium]|nr:PD40 domain-containing protein [Gemmatimonadota bacterium]
VIMYASHPDFEQTNAIPGELDEGTGGVTEAFKRRIVLPFAGPLKETDHVLGHELVHAFQYDITGQGRSPANPAAAGLFRLPLWFVEGMAEYLSVGPVDPHTAMWLRDAAKDTLPTLRKLDHPRYFPYRWGQAFWSYVGGRWGDEAVGRLLKRAGASGDLERAFIRTLGINDSTLSADWHEAIRAAYDPVASVTKTPDAYGEPVFVRTEGKNAQGARYNIAPALSPDGKRMVFISERDQFSIEMFVADMASKSVERKITKTAVDPHFESLQFINSAGAWSTDGRQFVFAGVRKGKPVLSVIDMASGDIVREVPLNDLGEVFNPTWSPDGRYVAFSALVGGLMDLYSYDLQEQLLKRLTNDAYAEIEPAWSPDGTTLAFVTDRFSSDLPRLRMGNYRIGLMDPSTGAIRPAPSFTDGKNVNPQWSPDGQSIYFVSDHNGISNIYRAELASGTIAQVTNLYTGVSGITDLSPALSVAARANQLAFSVFRKGNYGIYAIKDVEVLRGEPPRAAFPQGSPGVLPPANRDREGVVTALTDPTTGLPPTRAFAQEKYRSRLSLDFIGQPHLAAGVDSWGAFVGGGASAFWSDMLGNHNLATVLEVNGGYRDVTAAVAYTNLQRRLNWGLVAQQVPYVSGGLRSGYGDVGGEFAYLEQLILYRQTNRDIAALASYPFSRVRRIEFQGGLSNISFDEEIRTKAWAAFAPGAVTNRQILDSTFHLSTCTEDVPVATATCVPRSMNLAHTSAALVYDNSLFGATSPILGQRYRIEAAPMLGSLNVINLTFDYRKYLMPARPFTLAGRVVHYGRYGPDGDSPRLYPMYLGYQTIVRGYPQSSYNIGLACPVGQNACPAFDQLLGSRIAVANAELRFPLFGVLGLGGGYYGGVPIEMALFSDAGVAWTDSEPLWFTNGGTRRPVFSSGVALRLNLFGFAIIELAATHPWSRPDERGIVWQLGFAPGF